MSAAARQGRKSKARCFRGLTDQRDDQVPSVSRNGDVPGTRVSVGSCRLVWGRTLPQHRHCRHQREGLHRAPTGTAADALVQHLSSKSVPVARWAGCSSARCTSVPDIWSPRTDAPPVSLPCGFNQTFHFSLLEQFHGSGLCIIFIYKDQ